MEEKVSIISNFQKQKVTADIDVVIPLLKRCAEFQPNSIPVNALICQSCTKENYVNSPDSSNASIDDTILEPQNATEEAPEPKKFCLVREDKLEQESKRSKTWIGCFCKAWSKKGKRFPDGSLKKVVEYHNSDANSRVMTNKKDVVEIWEGNNIIHVPKDCVYQT